MSNIVGIIAISNEYTSKIHGQDLIYTSSFWTLIETLVTVQNYLAPDTDHVLRLIKANLNKT